MGDYTIVQVYIYLYREIYPNFLLVNYAIYYRKKERIIVKEFWREILEQKYFDLTILLIIG